jgi:hypothetical protein
MKIVGENGETLPPGEVGEVYMRPKAGPGTTYRYIGAEAKKIEGGWESLGDMGRMDEDGYLYLSDRETDMILVGGANIYPAEVEAAIDAFPGVRSSAVIGLPHEDLGNAIHAIVDAPHGNVTKEALLAHLDERLVRYKIPRTVEFVAEPLRDDAGKVRRKALRAARQILVEAPHRPVTMLDTCEIDCPYCWKLISIVVDRASKRRRPRGYQSVRALPIDPSRDGEVSVMHAAERLTSPNAAAYPPLEAVQRPRPCAAPGSDSAPRGQASGCVASGLDPVTDWSFVNDTRNLRRDEDLVLRAPRSIPS